MEPSKLSAKEIVAVVVPILALAIAIWWFSVKSRDAEQPSVLPEPSPAELQQATEAVVAPEVEVPTSANPIKESLPQETPLEKTNPFNKVYENPFQ